MKKILLLFLFVFLVTTTAKGDDFPRKEFSGVVLPDIQTFVIMPPEIKNICIWVSADKVGPLINRSCRIKGSCSYSMSLTADVHHDKNSMCPDIVARLLAQMVSSLHVNVLPLTIFNGWQWEYSYSMADYDAKIYALSARGGSWENCSEAVFIKTFGRIVSGWLSFSGQSENTFTDDSVSEIVVETFTDLRTRNGYPKQRKLK